jgi:hypothetical protein
VEEEEPVGRVGGGVEHAHAGDGGVDERRSPGVSRLTASANR